MSEPPALPVDGFRRVRTREDSAWVLPFLTARTVTALYEEAGPDPLAPLRPPEMPYGLRSRFTTSVSLFPRVPGGTLPEALLDVATRHAAGELADAFAADGLLDVERVDADRIDLPGGPPLRTVEFRAGYPLDGEATLGQPGRPVLAVGVLAGLWPAEAGFEMAGGTFPIEDLEAVARRAGTALATDATLTVSPVEDRALVREHVRAVATR